LVAYECQDCDWVSFPRERETCMRCGRPHAEFEEVQLAERATVRSYVVHEYLPDEFETPMPLAMLDIHQEGDGEPARAYGMLTETDLEELEVDCEVEARFREMFTDGDRPIVSFKFSIPREEKQ
jgi:uncharacterized OB-fold protein